MIGRDALRVTLGAKVEELLEIVREGMVKLLESFREGFKPVVGEAVVKT